MSNDQQGGAELRVGRMAPRTLEFGQGSGGSGGGGGWWLVVVRRR